MEHFPARLGVIFIHFKDLFVSVRAEEGRVVVLCAVLYLVTAREQYAVVAISGIALCADCAGNFTVFAEQDCYIGMKRERARGSNRS